MAKLKENSTEIVGNLDPKYWVQKADPLVLMRSVPFSLGELKILDTYISRINAADNTRRTVIFTKEEYEELMGLTCVDYRTLKKHTGGMLGKVVTLEMPSKEYVQFVLFEQARYHKDEYGKPIIELTCTTLAQDLFFCINKYHYFKYALENVINLTRKASYLLYVYIRYNRYRGEWEIDLKELRDNILDCKGQRTYQEFKEFKKAVLAPAVKEVNEKTDCHFDYEIIKRGRMVAKIKFIYRSAVVDLPELPQQLSLLDDPHLDEVNEQDEHPYLQLLSDACNNEFSDAEINELIAIMATMTNFPLPPTPDLPNFKWTPIEEARMSRYFYLQQQYARLNVEAERRHIPHRFAYLRQMILND